MTFLEILKLPKTMLSTYPWRFVSVVLLILCATFYPTNLKRDYAVLKNGKDSPFVTGIEDYGRHINTVVPLAIAVLARDVTGLKQMFVVTVSGIAATHGPKRLLDDVVVSGTRIGQRPSSPNSHHNTPSGHSALAASGAMIMLRRYSLWLGGLGVIITVLTMYGRYMLDQHTISATIAGALIGGVIAILFVTKHRK